MTNEQKYQLIENSGMIPVFYYDDYSQSEGVLKASCDAGLKVIEYTNRGHRSKENFAKLVEYKNANYPDTILGIGSVFEPKQAEAFMAKGADFIVSPIVSELLAGFCDKADIPLIPGAGTTTEIYTAYQLGAQIIKVFPGSVLGPEFVKAVLAPMPFVNLMPTGGVKPTEENLKAWYDAGVVTVGMGSQLLDKTLIESGDFETLTQKIIETKNLIDQIKN